MRPLWIGHNKSGASKGDKESPTRQQIRAFSFRWCQPGHSLGYDLENLYPIINRDKKAVQRYVRTIDPQRLHDHLDELIGKLTAKPPSMIVACFGALERHQESWRDTVFARIAAVRPGPVFCLGLNDDGSPNIRSPGAARIAYRTTSDRCYGGRCRKRHGCAVGRAALDHQVRPRGVAAGRALAERDQVPGRRELVSRAILRDEPSPHRLGLLVRRAGH